MDRAEKLTGLLWNAARQPSQPLWWCLDPNVKESFRRELDTLPDPNARPDIAALEDEVREGARARIAAQREP